MMITPITAISPYSCRYASEAGLCVPVKIANSATMNAAIADCVSVATCGLFHRWCVRPSTGGSTRSRPSE